MVKLLYFKNYNSNELFFWYKSGWPDLSDQYIGHADIINYGSTLLARMCACSLIFVHFADFLEGIYDVNSLVLKLST